MTLQLNTICHVFIILPVMTDGKLFKISQTSISASRVSWTAKLLSHQREATPTEENRHFDTVSMKKKKYHLAFAHHLASKVMWYYPFSHFVPAGEHRIKLTLRFSSMDKHHNRNRKKNLHYHDNMSLWLHIFQRLNYITKSTD